MFNFNLFWLQPTTSPSFSTKLCLIHLVAVDAWKAYDSVDHEYMLKVLEAYQTETQTQNSKRQRKKREFCWGVGDRNVVVFHSTKLKLGLEII